VGAPVAILSEQRLQALAVLAGVVALVLALGLAADAYAARALARPLTHLAASVQRIGGGDLAGPVPATARPDEVGTLAQAIEDMRRRLAEHAESQEQLNRLKDQYLFAVAHELRSPLAALAASAELLADEHAAMPPAERERFVGIVRRHTAGLQALVENLLDLGSLRAGRFRVHPQPTPLGPVLHEAAATVEPLLRHRRQRVEVAVAAPEPVALVDPRRLQQVLVNLLSNASKYGPEGDAIRLAAAPRDGAVHIEVADRGPGIPPEEQAQLFEAYFRSATASRAVPGVGLGLAIVKAIVDAHGGEVGVESALGQATRFWLRVPAAAPPQPPQPSDSPGPAVPAHEPGGRPNAQSAARTVAVDA
jgi:signal transduction histidine kinase